MGGNSTDITTGQKFIDVNGPALQTLSDLISKPFNRLRLLILGYSPDTEKELLPLIANNVDSLQCDGLGRCEGDGESFILFTQKVAGKMNSSDPDKNRSSLKAMDAGNHN